MILIRSHRRRAVILILTLWIAMILAVMAYSSAHEMQTSMRLVRGGHHRLQAWALARAGMARAVNDLRNDKLMAVADPTQWNPDTLEDVWAVSEDTTDIELGEGSYSVKVVDEERKLNLNYLTAFNLPALAYVMADLMEIDIDEAKEIAEMIHDWKDQDSTPIGGQGGDEAEFYEDWAYSNYSETLPDGWRWEAKNDLFFTLDELLEIPGITREVLYGSADDEERKSRRRRDEEPRDLASYVTVQSSGQVNINTVPPLLLEGICSLLQGSGGGAQGLANKIIDQRERQTPGKSSGEDVINAYQQLQEAGLAPEDVQKLNQIVNLNNVSNVFTIYATGTYEGVTRRLEARVMLAIEAYPSKATGQRTLRGRDEWRGSLRTRTDHVVDIAVRVDDMTDQ